MSAARSTLVPVALAFVAGCIGDLPEPWEVEGARILAARVEVEGETDRAWPRPGETATIRFLAAHDGEETRDLSWAISACLGVVPPSTAARCVSPAIALASETLTSAPATLEIPLTATVPPIPPDVPVDTLLLFGALCEGGAAHAGDGPEAAGCSDGAVRTNRFTYRLRVVREGEANRNPTIAGDALRIDDAAWPALPDGVLEDLCAEPDAAGLPVIAPGAGVELAMTMPIDQRETFVAEVGPTAEPQTVREALFVSWFASSGSLERPLSAIEGETAEEATVTWTAPDEPGAARFWMVVRDGRDGAHWATRAVCVR